MTNGVWTHANLQRNLIILNSYKRNNQDMLYMKFMDFEFTYISRLLKDRSWCRLFALYIHTVKNEIYDTKKMIPEKIFDWKNFHSSTWLTLPLEVYVLRMRKMEISLVFVDSLFKTLTPPRDAWKVQMVQMDPA